MGKNSDQSSNEQLPAYTPAQLEALRRAYARQEAGQPNASVAGLATNIKFVKLQRKVTFVHSKLEGLEKTIDSVEIETDRTDASKPVYKVDTKQNSGGSIGKVFSALTALSDLEDQYDWLEVDGKINPNVCIFSDRNPDKTEGMVGYVHTDYWEGAPARFYNNQSRRIVAVYAHLNGKMFKENIMEPSYRQGWYSLLVDKKLSLGRYASVVGNTPEEREAAQRKHDILSHIAEGRKVIIYCGYTFDSYGNVIVGMSNLAATLEARFALPKEQELAERNKAIIKAIEDKNDRWNVTQGIANGTIEAPRIEVDTNTGELHAVIQSEVLINVDGKMTNVQNVFGKFHVLDEFGKLARRSDETINAMAVPNDLSKLQVWASRHFVLKSI